ncbi:adenosine deaminase 2 [Anoplophora glabripennis]|uniref:adenosine deaminase 2 n=1 Tax=Anoplophora glabripennis TaxID=217634 RepID=UPI000875A381|nr:adenosine deaminase 2 [Anoplophora glabripennis]
MLPFLRLLFSALLAAAIMFSVVNLSESDDYLTQRINILNSDNTLFAGGKLNLSDKELVVNELILKEKKAELTEAHQNVSNFLPSRHFFQARPDIEKSNVFSIIKKLPKGASLHTHLTAAVSADFMIENITYKENIYGCFINGIFKLRFLGNADDDKTCDWKELKKYREEDPNFDQWLKKQMSLEVDNPLDVYPSIDVIWQRFKKIFSTAYDMVCYKPVFKEYIYQLLKELYEDNVMYTELRGTFMPLYDLNGTVYDTKEFFNVFIETVEEFKQDHPRFLGARYIHSIYRGVTPEVLKSGLDELITLKKLYPQFIAGFDFVGYEEEGRPIVEFHKVLLEASEELKFFFHAGETNWYGSTDLNLIDAVLLNSSRIGHAFALSRHPILMHLVKAKDIAIELCPISNQVLMLNEDPRTHPAISLLAKDFPVVISNDDPSAWGASGLSYDWYVAFLAMTPVDVGIEVLKKFAMDSIRYSAMNDDEKDTALEKWSLDWQIFLEDMLK